MPQTILAIDDLPEIHQLLDVRLKPEGLSVHHALSAEEGMRKASTLHPDLILLDIDMPEVSGLDLCQRLKANPSTAQIPIIFLTGSFDVATKVKGFDLGGIDYVTKPFDPAELRARVRAALRTKRYQDLLTSCARVDALTGLWNRAYFDQRLGDELTAEASRRRKICLVMMDLDHFKRLNDTYGHPFGDRVLQAAGDAFATSMRPTDAACRFGGDEFAIILSETNLAAGLLVTKRIREQLTALDLRPKGERVTITASIGIACTDQFISPTQPTVAGLIGAADRALYAAKHAGRDRICVAESPILPAVETSAAKAKGLSDLGTPHA